MSAPFVSQADLEALLGRPTTADELPIVIIALDSACEIVRGACGLSVNLAVDHEVVLDWDGARIVQLPDPPVVGVSAVAMIRGILEEDVTSFTARRSGRLELYPYPSTNAAIMWPLDIEESCAAELRVTYTHGWAPTEDLVDEGAGIFRVPSDIRRVALATALRMFGTLIRTTPEERDEIGAPVPDSSVLLEDDVAHLRRYRRNLVGSVRVTR